MADDALTVQFYNPESSTTAPHFPTPVSASFASIRRSTAVLAASASGFSVTASAAPISARSCRWANTIALLLGYRQIELWGWISPLLDRLCVDDANCLCRADRHYYDAGPQAAAAIYMKVPHVPHTMSVYLAEVAELPAGTRCCATYAAVARCADCQPHPRLDDRRLRTRAGITPPFVGIKEATWKGRFLCSSDSCSLPQPPALPAMISRPS